MKRDHKIFMMALHSLSVMLILASCSGGGGGGSSSASEQPLITAELDSFPTGSVPPGLLPSGFNSKASVSVNDINSFAPITNAAVTMNGVPLIYNATNQDFEGNLVVDPGGSVTLSVTVGGKTYTASGNQFTSYPVITSPTSSASWAVGNSHTMMWSGGGPVPSNGGSYALAIIDANDPNGDLVWPLDNYVWEVGSGVTSNIIPTNGLSIGNRLAIVGISEEVIATDNNTYYIDLYISGLNYVPFTVIPSPSPTNVIATPGSGQVSLTWTPVVGTTSYNLYWSTTAANANKASGNKIANVSSPEIHSGLINGTPYYYVITAVTSSGESVESTPITPAVPGASLMGGAVQGFTLALNNLAITLAGSKMSYGFADCIGTDARFSSVEGITTDGANLYIADSSNNIIRQIVISTGEVTTLAGRAGERGSNDGIGSAARFNGPSGITTDGTNLYVADRGNNNIRKIVITTGVVTTLAGAAGISGSADGTSSAARFNSPISITTDGTNLYVADTWNHTIRKVVISTGTVSTLAGAAGVSGSVDGTGSNARFYSPGGITTDGANLYVADTYNYTIRKIMISTGAVTTLAGQAGIFSDSIDGTGTTAAFADPTGITTDGTNLYVTDVNPSYGWHSCVRKIAISTGTTTTLPAINFYMSPGIVTDGIGLFVTDYNAVEMIQ